MFSKILIANRGEIACRIIRTARRLGIQTVAVYSDADALSQHVLDADEARHIGGANAADSYLNKDAILKAVQDSGAQAVHPGYGFLSEQAPFAQVLADNGVAFIGPPPHAIEAMGDKIASKKLAQQAGVATVPGYTGVIETTQQAIEIADDIGYPVMIKASAGGGGKGMRIAWSRQDVEEGFGATQRESASSFGDDRVFIEKFIQAPRHIEIQILADSFGTTLHLGERECSLQRRNQKVIEEAPSVFLQDQTRQAMCKQAIALAQAVDYTSAGTVEFIVDAEQNFYFLEMNTRLQVEHPVTELVTGLDLVEQMIRVAAGEPLAMQQSDITCTGHAIEARVYAEDPQKNFMPSIGRLTRYRPPPASETVRIDSGVVEGSTISMFYDPMIAKLCSWGNTRAQAIDTMGHALKMFELAGIQNNLGFLSALVDDADFQTADINTGFIEQNFDALLCSVPNNPLPFVCLAGVLQYTHNARLNPDAPQTLVVQTLAACYRVHIETNADHYNVTLEDNSKTTISLDGWVFGQTLCIATIDNTPCPFQVTQTPMGWDIQSGAKRCTATVLTQRQTALMVHMPVKDKTASQTSLISPMPGTVTQVFVKDGQSVQAGTPLCTIEAMKMENILRAEYDTQIEHVTCKAGDNVNVDDVLIAFKV